MIIARDLADRMGLKKYPRSWRGRCPCCDYPGGSFSVFAARDGTARLYCANGCSRDDLVNVIAGGVGQRAPWNKAEPHDADARERNRERALALWRGSEPAIGTLTDRYLTGRLLAGLAASPALRYRDDAPHPEGGRLPAMIALVTDVTEAPVGIHRTYLGRDGSKAHVEPAKASLGQIWGSAIRLDPLNPDLPLVVGEGVETSASAGHLMGSPAWAAINAGNLAKGLLLPPEARRVIIASDPDDAGRNAARDAWLRWKAEGRDVRIATPDGDGDFNEVLCSRRSV
jgi:putative DNA primase/helicase